MNKLKTIKPLVLTILVVLNTMSIPTAQAAENTDSNINYILNRAAYGVNAKDKQWVKSIGIDRWLDIQLKGDKNLPPEVVNEISSMEISQKDPFELIEELNVPKEQNNNEDFKKMIRRHEQSLVYETFRRDSLRAVYSPNQLREVMTWFWFNHFNVYAEKGQIKLFLPDYEESAIHKYALGNFKDLLRATLEHPAMSIYLDNIQNTSPNALMNQKVSQDKIKGINENYAREIMELHTLGQGQGYTQQDVQELAKILTGFGFKRKQEQIKMRPEYEQYAVEKGLFFFDPRRHDFGDKQFLGHTIHGQGYPEMEEVLDLLVNNPNTAKHISRQLATYFISDNPSNEIVNKMSQTFLKTHGDIAATLKTMFKSKEFWQQKDKFDKFRLPHEYIYASLRLTYNDNLITNYRPVWNVLNTLGEQPFGHLTPDGYGITEKDWASADQMEKRLNISQLFNNKKTNLFNKDESLLELQNAMNNMSNMDMNNKNNPPAKQPPMDNPANSEDMLKALGSGLSDNTRKVISEAKSNEKVGILLVSPEMISK